MADQLDSRGREPDAEQLGNLPHGDAKSIAEKEDFVRWQGASMAQLGYAVNLILALSVAALGFSVSLLLRDNIVPASWERCMFNVALTLISASIVLGIWCTINRLRDFRATAAVVRKKMRHGNSAEVKDLRRLSVRLGKCTWNLFWWQLGTFGVGVAATTVAILGLLQNKLL